MHSQMQQCTLRCQNAQLSWKKYKKVTSSRDGMIYEGRFAGKLA